MGSRENREEWAAAYVAQAEEDLRAAIDLQGRYDSVLAMLLQMVFEKLAKAALLYGKRIDVKKAQRSHNAAVILMSIFRELPQLLDLFPGKAQRQWLPTVTLVEQLTKLHPQLAKGGPHLEYPWEREDGTIGVPSKDLTGFLQSLWGDPAGATKRQADLFIFARVLANNAEVVFKKS